MFEYIIPTLCLEWDGQRPRRDRAEKTGTRKGEKQKKHFECLYLGAEELALANQFFVLVEFDAVPETHAASAKQTWKTKTPKNKIQIKFVLSKKFQHYLNFFD